MKISTWLVAFLLCIPTKIWALDILCRVEDSTQRKSNEAPAVLKSDSAKRDIEVLKNKNRIVESERSPVAPLNSDRCLKKSTCLLLDDSGPLKYVLCDSTYNVQMEAYTDNVLVHVVDAATRRDIVRATVPIKVFSSLSLSNEKPEVSIHCELARESNKDCKKSFDD